MPNFDTLDAITDNLETVLKARGINFAAETYDDIATIPISLIPLGQIFFEGVNFEYTHGEKPAYAEADFLIRVVLQEQNPRILTRDEQDWIHRIRDNLTVNALNIGNLASSKLISKVDSRDISVDHEKPQYGVLSYGVRIRYREL